MSPRSIAIVISTLLITMMITFAMLLGHFMLAPKPTVSKKAVPIDNVSSIWDKHYERKPDGTGWIVK